MKRFFRRHPAAGVEAVESAVADLMAGCPVSKLIKVEIGFEATLTPQQVIHHLSRSCQVQTDV